MMGRIARRAMRTAARLSPPRLATRLLSAIEARRTRSSVSEVTGPSLKAQQVGAGGSAVVLAADALVVPYRRSLAQAAAIAREEGLRVIVLRCRGALGACISKRFSGIEPAAMGTQVDSICTLCALSGAAEPMPAGCEVRWMEQLTDVEQGQLDERLLGELPAEALARHEVDGVPIGAICASELLHNMRLLRVDARDPNQEAVMRSKIRAAVRSLRAFQSLMKTETVSVLIHFSDYSYHLVAAMAARRAGVRVVNLTHPALFNVSPVRVIALPRTTLEHCYTMVHAWPRFAERPLPPERVELLSRDQIFRMTGGGSHIFSPVRGDAPQALRDRLRIDLGRPVVVAFTSSPDELNSIELWSSAVGIDLATFPDPFDSQIAWLEYTAEALASEPSSPLLVVRLHPREGSRGGSEAQSEHLRLLRTRLEHRPELRVIWPDDAISSYDLGEIATCVNTSWSSLGQEFSRAGAEVVRAFGMKVPIPLGVFSRYSASKQGYSAELRRSLVAPPSLKRITSALRWHNLEYLGSAFDPGERAPATGGSRWPGRHELAALVHGRHEIMDAMVGSLPIAGDSIAEQEERHAIEKALRRLLAVLCGEPPPASSAMCLDAPEQILRSELLESDPSIGADGIVSWRVGDRTLRRDTVLARRLVQLIHQAMEPSGLGALPCADDSGAVSRTG